MGTGPPNPLSHSSSLHPEVTPLQSSLRTAAQPKSLTSLVQARLGAPKTSCAGPQGTKGQQVTGVPSPSPAQGTPQAGQQVSQGPHRCQGVTEQ